MERIMWEQRSGIGRSGWDGLVNGKHLFTIERGVRSGDGWILRTVIPWKMKDAFRIGRTAEADVMKHRAEMVLEAFVSKIGAAFPTDVPEASGQGDH